MKTLFTALMAVASISLSCAPQPGPVRITTFLPNVPGTCAGGAMGGMAGDFTSAGQLDVASGDATFFVGIQLTSTALVQPAVVVNGRTIESANRDKPILEEMVLNYSSKSGPSGLKLPAIKEARQPALINFIEQETATIPRNIISTGAAIALDTLGPSNAVDDFVDLIVDVEFVGRMSGSGARIDTGRLPYSIRAYRSEVPTTCIVRKAHGVCENPSQGPLFAKPTLECCTGANAGIGCPADTDKDGVLDPLDKCVSMPMAMVNPEGCP